MQMTSTATRVNLGPLTTTFSAPPDCTSLRFIAENEAIMGAHLNYGCYGIQSIWAPCAGDAHFACYYPSTSIPHPSFSLINTCYPPNFASSFTPGDYNTGKWTFQPRVYSPGLACPSGYLSQCTIERVNGLPNSAATTQAAQADQVIWGMLNDGETAIGCCPS